MPDTVRPVAPREDELVAALRELTTACEQDFCSDETRIFGDCESVMDGVLDGSYIKFGMIRHARALLNRLAVSPVPWAGSGSQE
jgi:hypothetical protein